MCAQTLQSHALYQQSNVDVCCLRGHASCLHLGNLGKLVACLGALSIYSAYILECTTQLNPGTHSHVWFVLEVGQLATSFRSTTWESELVLAPVPLKNDGTISEVQA